jgi:hypothetical protein
MTRPSLQAADVTPETARLFRDLIGLLAGAIAEDDMRRDQRKRSRPYRRGPEKRVRPVALALARYAAAGNEAGLRSLLTVHRPESEWRGIAYMLASAADLERLAAPGPADTGREAA